MTPELAIDLFRAALTTALMLASPVLAIALCVGLCVSLFQTVIGLQEQTLSFVPKLLAVGGAAFVGLPWFLKVLAALALQLFTSLPELAR